MNKKEREFQAFVFDWYDKCGRHDLPWRQTNDPYQILVSELMLQQTQVQRVIPKFEAFIAIYPTLQTLSQATLGDVLRLWQGLGYNRRAKFLRECAQAIVGEHAGVFPATPSELLQLPGIGPYTASAICAFAYNQPVELIETNVRQVYIHHFFKRSQEVTDAQILHLVRRTLPLEQSRRWYAALMDYGSHLKSIHGNNTRKLKGYTTQSKFTGSDREVRAAIVRALVQTTLTKEQLWATLARYDQTKIQPQVEGLIKDQMILKTKRGYRLP
jgi:A/G-specific adenine glycosylase